MINSEEEKRQTISSISVDRLLHIRYILIAHRLLINRLEVFRIRRYMLMTAMKQTASVFRLKDPVSCLTHFSGFLISLPAGYALLLDAAAKQCSLKTLIGLAIFSVSLSLLYGASASYHAFRFDSWIDGLFKRIDHCSIFVLIAGSYTPVCLSVLPASSGRILLAVIWCIAAAGILFKIFWVTCPRFVSSIMYIAMGWACISVLPQLLTGLGSGFSLLLAGGLFYTVGGVIYALKLPLFPGSETTGFGNHELFHLFVLAGSLCHWLMMLGVVTAIG